MESEETDLSAIVRLDIGGMKFTTTIRTLTERDPDSMLAAMFSGRHSICKDAQKGTVFIERDGTHFRHILNWLRDGVVSTLDESGCQELLREAEYYQLLGLIEQINLNLSRKKEYDDSKPEMTRKEVIKCIQSKRVRLRGINLSGVDLSKLDLSGVDFSHAHLQRTFFSKANLQSAKFRDSEADGSNFHTAFLRECEFSNASLRGAIFTGAILQSANLQDANLECSSFRDADLHTAHLQGADLTNANLTGANLEGANLKGAKLNGANLQGANLQRAYLRFVDLRGTDPNKWYQSAFQGQVLLQLQRFLPSNPPVRRWRVQDLKVQILQGPLGDVDQFMKAFVVLHQMNAA